MTETPRDPHDPSSDPSSTEPSGFTDEDRPDTAPTEVVRAGQAAPSPADTQPYLTGPTAPIEPAYLAQPTVSSQPPSYGQPGQGQPDPGFPAGADAGFDENGAGAGSGSGDGTGAGEPPQPPQRAGRRKGLSPLALVLIGALVGGGVGGGVAVAATSALTQPESASSSTSGSSQTIKVNNESSVTAVTAAAVKASPSVVTITTVAGGSSSSSSSSSASGTGSGVIWSSDGYIVTNNHVVTLDGQTSTPDLTVTLSNGKQYPAKVVGLDASADLAVIKISATGLTPISLGDSSKINVGDTAVALGAPLGLSNSVTDGIVSALNRGISVASSAAGSNSDSQSQSGGSPFGFWGFGDQGQQGQSSQQSTISLSVIQTDASINPGNSGGALVNTAGKLIGLNVAIASAGSSSSSSDSQSGSIGVGFAIPVNTVERVANALIKDGKVAHGLLGATISDSDTSSAVTGAVVRSIEAGGPAASGGLKAGDIITGVDSASIQNATDLTAYVRSLAPGTEVTVTYERGGSSSTAQVTLGTAKS